MLRVFVDSSVLFAASRSETGTAHDLLIAGAAGLVDLSVSSLVVIETDRNLSRKGSTGLQKLAEVRNAGFLRLIEPPESLIRDVAAHIEPKDAPIVAGALAASADALATFDRKHLLARASDILDLYGLIVATPGDLIDRPGS